MKVAACLSGQLGSFRRTYNNQRQMFLAENQCDIFALTSNAVSQRVNMSLHYPPSTPVYEYLPNIRWYKSYPRPYGIIYNTDERALKYLIGATYGDTLKELRILDESAKESLNDIRLPTKWDWMRKRQLNKMYACNKLMHKHEKENNTKYDIVIRARFDIALARKINVEQIVSKYDNIENKLFGVGGFPCTPPNVFMKEFLCDGFAFGTPEVMDVYTGLYEQEKPYPHLEEYNDYHSQWGEHVESQLRTHLERNGIEIVHIIDERKDYQIVR